MNQINHGILYVVATPIGNLDDMTFRAKIVLESVDIIAAEDTRHSRRLMTHYGVTTKMLAYHDHNEESQSQKLVEKLLNGDSIALISDAGTPLINDPGFRLVSLAHANQIAVVPIPGSSAAIAALSASGLTVNRFTFEGFPSAKHGTRINQFEALKSEQRTMVFYVSSHRILDTLKDMAQVFGGEREVTFARELTKTFETIKKSTFDELCQWVASDHNQSKGEIVVVISGCESKFTENLESESILRMLLDELPVKQAVKLATKLSGGNKNDLYKKALEIKSQS